MVYSGKLDDGVFDNLNSLTKLVLDGNARIKLSNKVIIYRNWFH
jgi:hypothetical protein